MEKLNTYTYEKKDFYLLDELKAYDPKFFYGCAQMGPEKIIKKKNITDYEVVKYIKNTDNEYEWSSSTFTYKRSKLLVGVEWACNNIPKLGRAEGYKYPDAPPILELNKHEYFTDDEGNVYDVETRGERSEDKVFFKAKDVGEIFDMKNLPQTIIDRRTNYFRNEDYMVFSICTRLDSIESCTDRVKPYIFLTYTGLLKTVYESRSGIAKRFRKWATRIVYTAHLGTPEQRDRVAKQIRRADPESVKTVLKCSVTSTPCIYLFCLGTVKDLKENDIFREALTCPSGLKNSLKVYKYGKSVDLKRRTGEHKRSWSSARIEIQLTKYAYIDPQYISRVELELKNYLSDELDCRFLKVNHNNEVTNEIVLLSNQQLKLLSDKYVDFSKEYGGCLTDITKTNIELERRLETLTLEHEVENSNYKIEMEKSTRKIETLQLEKELEMEKLNHKLDLKDKELEILQLKMEMLSLKKA